MFETIATTALMNQDISTYVALTNLEKACEHEDVKKTKVKNTPVEKEVVNSTKDVHTQKTLRTIRDMYN